MLVVGHVTASWVGFAAVGSSVRARALESSLVRARLVLAGLNEVRSTESLRRPLVVCFSDWLARLSTSPSESSWLLRFCFVLSKWPSSHGDFGWLRKRDLDLKQIFQEQRKLVREESVAMLLQRRGRSHHLSGGVAEASPRPAAGRGAPTSPRAAPISGPRAGSTRVRAQTTSSSSTSVLPVLPYDLDEGVEQGMWHWADRGVGIRYQKAGAGNSGPSIVLIHGFGGNADHWRKNIGPLAKTNDCRVFAIDLLGYGYSDKPDPAEYGEPNALYNFYVWADQLNAFVDEGVHADRPEGATRDTVLVCNSVGSVAGLQAIADSDKAGASDYKGIMLLNPSLRLLHVSKQSWFAKPFVKAFQDFLRLTPFGKVFFSQVAQPRAISNILKEAYCDPATVTDDLVACVLNPGLTDGAVKVFLDFLSYSGGPLPEELIPEMPCPVDLVWGQEDPWEPIDLGRKEFANFDTVRSFVPLPGVGHCPMDEAPQLVNPLVEDFVTAVCTKGDS